MSELPEDLNNRSAERSWHRLFLRCDQVSLLLVLLQVLFIVVSEGLKSSFFQKIIFFGFVSFLSFLI